MIRQAGAKKKRGEKRGAPKRIFPIQYPIGFLNSDTDKTAEWDYTKFGRKLDLGPESELSGDVVIQRCRQIKGNNLIGCHHINKDVAAAILGLGDSVNKKKNK